MKLVALCESVADFRIATALVDRVLRDAGPDWVGDVMDVAVESIRSYYGDGEGREFFDIHKLDVYARQLSTRVPHGHFDGKPGAAGALMARTAFHIVRSITRIRGNVDAAILIWDMDDQPDERRTGLVQARAETEAWATFRIVLGGPNPMREAWVLVGFEPDGAEEAARLADLRRDLGFSPTVDAHLLTAKDKHARRSAKRVLRSLTLDDPSREERCWRETPLETLRQRGEPSGLSDFLADVERSLAPLCIIDISGQ